MAMFIDVDMESAVNFPCMSSKKEKTNTWLHNVFLFDSDTNNVYDEHNIIIVDYWDVM